MTVMRRTNERAESAARVTRLATEITKGIERALDDETTNAEVVAALLRKATAWNSLSEPANDEDLVPVDDPDED